MKAFDETEFLSEAKQADVRGITLKLKGGEELQADYFEVVPFARQIWFVGPNRREISFSEIEFYEIGQANWIAPPSDPEAFAISALSELPIYAKWDEATRTEQIGKFVQYLNEGSQFGQDYQGFSTWLLYKHHLKTVKGVNEAFGGLSSLFGDMFS